MTLTDTHTILGRYAEDLAKARIQIVNLEKQVKELNSKLKYQTE